MFFFGQYFTVSLSASARTAANLHKKFYRFGSDRSEHPTLGNFTNPRRMPVNRPFKIRLLGDGFGSAISSPRDRLLWRNFGVCIVYVDL